MPHFGRRRWAAIFRGGINPDKPAATCAPETAGLTLARLFELDIIPHREYDVMRGMTDELNYFTYHRGQKTGLGGQYENN